MFLGVSTPPTQDHGRNNAFHHHQPLHNQLDQNQILQYLQLPTTPSRRRLCEPCSMHTQAIDLELGVIPLPSETAGPAGIATENSQTIPLREFPPSSTHSLNAPSRPLVSVGQRWTASDIISVRSDEGVSVTVERCVYSAIYGVLRL